MRRARGWVAKGCGALHLHSWPGIGMLRLSALTSPSSAFPRSRDPYLGGRKGLRAGRGFMLLLQIPTSRWQRRNRLQAGPGP